VNQAFLPKFNFLSAQPSRLLRLEHILETPIYYVSSTCLLSPDLCRLSMSVRIPIHGFYDPRLSSQQPPLPLHPFVGYRTSSADSVLLDATDSAKRCLEERIDSSAKSKCHIPPVIDRAKKQSQREYYGSRGLVLHYLHGSSLPCLPKFVQNTPSCKVLVSPGM